MGPWQWIELIGGTALISLAILIIWIACDHGDADGIDID